MITFQKSSPVLDWLLEMADFRASKFQKFLGSMPPAPPSDLRLWRSFSLLTQTKISSYGHDRCTSAKYLTLLCLESNSQHDHVLIPVLLVSGTMGLFPLVNIRHLCAINSFLLNGCHLLFSIQKVRFLSEAVESMRPVVHDTRL